MLSTTYFETLEFVREKYAEDEALGQYSGTFSELVAMGTTESLQNGDIYFGQEELERYVRRVLLSLLKDSTQAAAIKIRFVRDKELNGAMSAAGDLYLNVGTLAYLNNEAELAALLGHEFGHYMNDHGAYRYAEIATVLHRKKEFYEFGTRADKASANLRAVLKFTKTQEEAADLYSINLLRNTAYSIPSAIGLYRLLNRGYILKKIKYGPDNESYHSHPEPAERIRSLRHLDPAHKAGRRFIVDSLMFRKLNRFGYTETINICLLENRFSNLFDLCFKQYLLEPQDHVNLSILVEALRRTRLFIGESEFNSRPFMLDGYQTDHIKNSLNYAFLNDPAPSILEHLDAGFVSLWKEDLKRVKAEDLLDKSTIEFTSYKEAYNYFVIRLEHSDGWPSSPDPLNADQSTAETNLHHWAKSIFGAADYLRYKAGEALDTGSLYVMVAPDYAQASEVLNVRGFIDNEDWRNQFVRTVSRTSGTKLKELSEFSVYDQHQLRSLISHADYFLKGNNSGERMTSDVNWAEIAPELFSIFKTKEVSKIYVLWPTIWLNSRGAQQVSLYSLKIGVPVKEELTLHGQQDGFELNENSDALEEEIGRRFMRFKSRGR